MTEKRMPAAERQQETVSGCQLSSGRVRITGRIPGLVPGLERALTRSGEPVEKKMTEIPEPKDKLDATAMVVVSGPEDDAERWRQVDWRRAEADVRRLRQRIFTASKAGDLGKGPPVAEVDAAVPLEHAGERAQGDRAQRGSSDRRNGRRGGAHPGQGDFPAGRLPLCSGPSLHPVVLPIDRALASRGINQGFTRVHPSGLPLACARPDGTSRPLGLNLGLRTPPTRSRTTHAEEGTGHRARTWNYRLNSHFVDLQSR